MGRLKFKWLVLLFLSGAQSLTWAADVNVASLFQLESTRGIGQKMAEQIVAERAAHGNFKSWDDFAKRIKGVGDNSLKVMQKDGLTLEITK